MGNSWEKIPHLAAVNRQGSPIRSPFARRWRVQHLLGLLCCPRWCPHRVRVISGVCYDDHGWADWRAVAAAAGVDPVEMHLDSALTDDENETVELQTKMA